MKPETAMTHDGEREGMRPGKEGKNCHKNHHKFNQHDRILYIDERDFFRNICFRSKYDDCAEWVREAKKKKRKTRNEKKKRKNASHKEKWEYKCWHTKHEMCARTHPAMSCLANGWGARLCVGYSVRIFSRLLGICVEHIFGHVSSKCGFGKFHGPIK